MLFEVRVDFLRPNTQEFVLAADYWCAIAFLSVKLLAQIIIDIGQRIAFQLTVFLRKNDTSLTLDHRVVEIRRAQRLNPRAHHLLNIFGREVFPVDGVMIGRCRVSVGTKAVKIALDIAPCDKVFKHMCRARSAGRIVDAARSQPEHVQ